MTIESNLKLIKQNGGIKLIIRDQKTIREALEETEFKFDGVIWTTKKEDFDIICWLTYEIDTILSPTILMPFVEKLLELKADGYNDQKVRNLDDQTLINVAFDLRYAKGTGEKSMYQRMLTKHKFIVFDPSVQIERICHTIKTEMEYRMK